MDRRPQSPSLVEMVLTKMRKQEKSPWGRIQVLGHKWLTRLERNRLILSYHTLLSRRASAIGLRSDPAIDIDSSFFLSLLFHLLLLILLSWITFSSRPQLKPGPIRVRFLDVARQVQRKPTKSLAKPSPKASKVSKKKPAVVAPKPVPALPAPKVLAKPPKEEIASLAAESAEDLIRLPTRQSGVVQTPQLKVETTAPASVTPVSEDELKVPRELLRGEGPPATKGSPSVLSNPEFAPYLEVIKRRVQSVWQYPEGISGVHRVNLVFVLDPGGKLVRVEILDPKNSKLDNSAVRAMKRASPFPPIPDSLKALAGSPLRIRFTVDFGVKVAR